MPGNRPRSRNANATKCKPRKTNTTETAPRRLCARVPPLERGRHALLRLYAAGTTAIPYGHGVAVQLYYGMLEEKLLSKLLCKANASDCVW